MIQNLFQKMAEKAKIPNSSYEVSITLILKLDEVAIKRENKRNNIPHEREYKYHL